MRNAGLEEAQAGIKIAGRNINNIRYADDTTLMAESKEELKSLLKEKCEKAGLKLTNKFEENNLARCPQCPTLICLYLYASRPLINTFSFVPGNIL